MPGLVSAGKDAEAALVTRRPAKWSPDPGQAYFQGAFWSSVGGALGEGSLRGSGMRWVGVQGGRKAGGCVATSRWAWQPLPAPA